MRKEHFQEMASMFGNIERGIKAHRTPKYSWEEIYNFIDPDAGTAEEIRKDFPWYRTGRERAHEEISRGLEMYGMLFKDQAMSFFEPIYWANKKRFMDDNPQTPEDYMRRLESLVHGAIFREKKLGITFLCNKEIDDVVADDLVVLYNCEFTEDAKILADDVLIVGDEVECKSIRGDNTVTIMAPVVSARTISGRNICLLADMVSVEGVKTHNLFRLTPENKKTIDVDGLNKSLEKISRYLKEYQDMAAASGDDEAVNEEEDIFRTIRTHRRASSPKMWSVNPKAKKSEDHHVFHGSTVADPLTDEEWNKLKNMPASVLDALLEGIGIASPAMKSMSMDDLVAFLRGMSLVKPEAAVQFSTAIRELFQAYEEDLKNQAAASNTTQPQTVSNEVWEKVAKFNNASLKELLDAIGVVSEVYKNLNKKELVAMLKGMTFANPSLVTPFMTKYEEVVARPEAEATESENA